jgi:hypothetical protein
MVEELKKYSAFVVAVLQEHEPAKWWLHEM